MDLKKRMIAAGLGLTMVVTFAVGNPFGRLSVAMAQTDPYGADSDRCDNGVNLDDAVVGTLIAGTSLFFAPDENSATIYSVEQGQTFWVVDQDETGAWFQIVLACDLFWVPADLVTSTADFPWFDRPVPRTIPGETIGGPDDIPAEN